MFAYFLFFFFFSSRRRHTRCLSDWSSDVCSSDLCRLARSEGFARHVHADIARVREIEHRGEERGACDRVLAAGGQHRQRTGEERSADAKTERSEERRVGKERKTGRGAEKVRREKK